MKKLFIVLAFLYSAIALSDGPVFNQVIKSELRLTCIPPIEYTDDTPLAQEDIVNLTLYQSTSLDGPWQRTVIDGADCVFIKALTGEPDGQYYAKWTATALSEKTNNVPRESQDSNIYPYMLRAVVFADPKAPTGATGE